MWLKLNVSLKMHATKRQNHEKTGQKSKKLEESIMKSNQKWFYDENIQVGTDYQDISNVQAYDLQMAKFRDVKKEETDIIEAISLGREPFTT